MASVDVVISGIGGRFPHANNIEELGERLLQGKSLLETINRWNPGSKNTPKTMGSTHEHAKFDNTFFGMHYLLSLMTDPSARIAVEIAFEAIVDAGVNPSAIRGTNVHVYAGITQFEGDSAFDFLLNSTGYAIMGRNRCMAANRISYWFDFTGRSCSYDGFGGWAGEGLHLARQAIQSGECDSAIVMGLTLAAFLSNHKTKDMFGLLSPDDKPNPYSDSVNGFVRGDAQVAFLVQRADIAKRSYGSIVVTGSESQGPLPNWFLSVNEDHFRRFVSSQYSKNRVNPAQVKILEADGLCNKAMVETELKVLDEILNRGRPSNNPLYLGSVKTILGESEGAGGLVSLTKLILALETGVISPTIHRGRLNPNIQGLTDGRLKILTEPTKLEVTPDTVVAVSSLSYQGVVGHIALKANGKNKKTYDIKDYPLPYLVLISGRSESIVEKSLKKVTSSAFDPEYLRLTQEVFCPTIRKFDWKGYGFYGQESSGKFVIQRENRRPVWFVYSGMGSQWSKCGKDLLFIPVIRETLQRLHNILALKNMDLMNIVTEADDTIFDNILNSFVCITAIQICLTNLMNQLGIKPDGIIGHSVGELGCSYADGCLTEEETILASYARGVASLEADLIPGLMAAVGISADKAQKILPSEVAVACRNSQESCTISGPTEDVEKVVKDFTAKGIFVRKVNVANIAYHSPYIKPAAPYLLNYLQQVITTPKVRSSKWVCTSAPEEKWDSDDVRYCSAEYHTNNLLSQVYFEEGSAHIPKNALVIELAPHGLLQAILKRSLGEGVAHVPLTKRGVSLSTKFLLEAIGKLFLEGCSPKIWHMYPDVPMPVSRNTPCLIPLIEWNHEEDFVFLQRVEAPEIDTSVIDQFSPAMEVAGVKCLVPMHILYTTWENFAAKMRLELNACPVVFTDVVFHELVKLEDKALEMTSFIMMGSDNFETFSNDTLVASGKIRLHSTAFDVPLKQPQQQDDVKLSLHSDDVYAEMRSRGIGILEKMRSIHKVQIHPEDWIAEVDVEDGNWTRLLNSLLILFQLRNCERNQTPSSVNHIRRLVLNPDRKIFNRGAARLHLPSSTLLFDGIEMYEVSFKSIERTIPMLEVASHHFIPYGKTALQSQESFLIYIILLCTEKSLHPVFKILDFDNKYDYLTQKLQVILSSHFSLNSKVTKEWQDLSLILCEPTSLPSLSNVVAAENVLILSEVDGIKGNAFEESLENCGLRVVAEHKGVSSKRLVASASTLRPQDLSSCAVIKLGPEDEIPRTAMYSSEKVVILVWERGSKKSPNKIFSEISDLEGAGNLRLVFIMTPNSPPFSLDLKLYSEQLRLNMPVNVYFNGQWGNYRALPVPKITVADATSDIVDSSMTTDRTGVVKIRYIGLNCEQHTSEGGIVEPSKRIWDYSGENTSNGRIMGIATFNKASATYSRDPCLVWSVPDSWTLEDAVTVPCAYSFAFFVLFEVAKLQLKERVFITCPLTPIGQAALRIAFSLDCDVYVLVESVNEKEQLLEIFPNLIHENIMISRCDVFQFHLRTTVPKGFRVVISHLSGSRVRACSSCVNDKGVMVQINSEPMHSRDHLGLQMFTRSCCMSIRGVSENSLLNAPIDVKNRVKEWVERGLNSGLVNPNNLREIHPRNKMKDVLQLKESDDVSKRAVFLLEEQNGFKNRRNFVVNKSPSIIIGGSKTQWLKLAYYLARKGSKCIFVASEQSSPSIFTRHAQILHREFNASLKDLTVTESGAKLVTEVTKSGPIESIFFFDQNKLSEDMVQEILTNNWKEVQLVFLSKESTYFTRTSHRWVQEGFKVKAAVNVDDAPNDRVTPFLDWLLSPASATVNDLSGQCHSVRRSGLVPFSDEKLLPESSAELAQLGAAIRGKTAPEFREIITRCTRAKVTHEINPLFYIKGIHGQASLDVESIARDLLAPMFQVTLHATANNLEETARAVVQGIQKIQKNGPFNLAGDSIRTDLILRVAHILEVEDFASVVFLMDERIKDMREALSVLQNENRLSSSILELCLSRDIQGWKSARQLSWEDQVSTALSKIHFANEEKRENVVTALKHIKVSMEHIIEAQDEVTLKHGIVRSIRKGDDFKDFYTGERRHVHIVPESNLSNKKLSEIFSANLATPILQLDLERTHGKCTNCKE